MYISSDVGGGRVRASMVDIMYAVFDCAILQLLSVVCWLPELQCSLFPVALQSK